MHDIYNERRERTSLKFSAKTNYMRDDDEYSLTAKVIIGVGDCILLEQGNFDKLEIMNSLLLSGETSIMTVERLIYHCLGIDIDRTKARLITTKTEKNDFYDYWFYKTEGININNFSNEERTVIKVNYDEFIELIEDGLFDDEIPKEAVDAIFDRKEKPKVRPLIRKVNVM